MKSLTPTMRQTLKRLAYARIRGFLLLSVHKSSLHALERRGLVVKWELTKEGWSEATILLDPADREIASMMATGSFRLASLTQLVE